MVRTVQAVVLRYSLTGAIHLSGSGQTLPAGTATKKDTNGDNSHTCLGSLAVRTRKLQSRWQRGPSRTNRYETGPS